MMMMMMRQARIKLTINQSMTAEIFILPTVSRIKLASVFLQTVDFANYRLWGMRGAMEKNTLLDLSLSFSSSNVLFEAPIELVVSDIVMNILA